MRNHRNATAVLIVTLAWWVMLIGWWFMITGSAEPAPNKRTLAWKPTVEACQSASLSDRQAVACELAADTAYGPSLEESR